MPNRADVGKGGVVYFGIFEVELVRGLRPGKVLYLFNCLLSLVREGKA